MRTTSWTGKVGLMYISDYMYAAYLNVCMKPAYHATDSTKDYWNTNCKGTDWLYNSSKRQWTIFPLFGSASYVFSVPSVGLVFSNEASYAYGVRTTVFLKSNITNSGGSGTNGDPYKLSIS